MRLWRSFLRLLDRYNQWHLRRYHRRLALGCMRDYGFCCWFVTEKGVTRDFGAWRGTAG